MRWFFAFHSFDSSAVLVKDGGHVNVFFGMLKKSTHIVHSPVHF